MPRRVALSVRGEGKHRRVSCHYDPTGVSFLREAREFQAQEMACYSVPSLCVIPAKGALAMTVLVCRFTCVVREALHLTMHA
ncbi:MAG TPA: hypothetical protein VKQ30_20050 [Ktedonobacterales bacterium]|nr:hypothetical protein [Ktedonobacterales bacterium]